MVHLFRTECHEVPYHFTLLSTPSLDCSYYRFNFIFVSFKCSPYFLSQQRYHFDPHFCPFPLLSQFMPPLFLVGGGGGGGHLHICITPPPCYRYNLPQSPPPPFHGSLPFFSIPILSTLYHNPIPQGTRQSPRLPACLKK